MRGKALQRYLVDKEKDILPPFDNVVPIIFLKSQTFETLTKFMKKLLISTIPKIYDVNLVHLVMNLLIVLDVNVFLHIYLVKLL